MSNILKDTRVVIIFGGDGYVGSAAAMQLEQAGWIAIRASRKTPHDSLHISCDITDNASIRNVFDVTMKEHGRIDACIHAASPSLERIPFLSSSPESFESHMRTAVDGTLYMATTAQTFITLKNIVVITSKATDATKSKMGAYPFAKKIQHELCATLADTLPESICIHAIAPGFLPGGLNNDLPHMVRETFAKGDTGIVTDAKDIARIIVDICEQKPQYRESSVIDGMTGIVTPF